MVRNKELDFNTAFWVEELDFDDFVGKGVEYSGG